MTPLELSCKSPFLGPSFHCFVHEHPILVPLYITALVSLVVIAIVAIRSK